MTVLKNGILLVSVMMLSACQSFSDSMWMHPPQPKPVAPIEVEPTSLPISNLYNNPALDAEIALAVKDYRILALAGENTLPPGVPQRIKLANLSKFCGLRTLPSLGVVVDDRIDTKQRERFFNYAQQYNQFVLAACEKDFGRALR